MSVADGRYELWTGTPNAMGGSSTKDGRPAPLAQGSLNIVKTAAKRHLAALKPQAAKFDHTSEAKIIWAGEEIGSLHVGMMRVGDIRSWQWQHLSIQSRIEIRRTS